MLSNIGGHPNEDPSEDSNYTVSDQTMEITDHIWNEGNDAFEMEDIVKEFVNQVYSTMNSEVRGLMPASFLEQIEILNKDKVLSWKQILKKYVGTVVAGKRKTRTRLNRRHPKDLIYLVRLTKKSLKLL